jgi:hypothetical protein
MFIGFIGQTAPRIPFKFHSYTLLITAHQKPGRKLGLMGFSDEISELKVMGRMGLRVQTAPVRWAFGLDQLNFTEILLLHSASDWPN